MPALLHQLANARGDLLAAIVAEFDGCQHFVFGRLLRAGFHHHDAVFGARDDDVELGFAWSLRRSGLATQLAVDHADAHAAQHVLERNIGNGQRRAGADDGQRGGIARPDRPRAPCR